MTDARLSFQAIWNDQEVPKLPAKIQIFQHKVEFMEVLTESVPQVSLQWLFFAEFGIKDISSPLSASVQVLSFVTSTVSIYCALSKVRNILAIAGYNKLQQIHIILSCPQANRDPSSSFNYEILRNDSF